MTNCRGVIGFVILKKNVQLHRIKNSTKDKLFHNKEKKRISIPLSVNVNGDLCLAFHLIFKCHLGVKIFYWKKREHLKDWYIIKLQYEQREK